MLGSRSLSLVAVAAMGLAAGVFVSKRRDGLNTPVAVAPAVTLASGPIDIQDTISGSRRNAIVVASQRVAPAVVKTRFATALYEGREEEASRAYPLQRLGEPEDISGVVAFLLSEDAAWLTGQVLRIEGNRLNRLQGWTVAAVHPSRSGQALTYEELVDAVPQLYGAAPVGRATGAGQ